MTPEPMSDAEIRREKQERNSRVADLYDELARAGKHGHYESLFRIVRIEVERAIAARDAQWREMLGEPVAWQTFDGEGGYEYRAYEENEGYAEDWAKRNPRHAGWVSPLYAIKDKP